MPKASQPGQPQAAPTKRDAEREAKLKASMEEIQRVGAQITAPLTTKGKPFEVVEIVSGEPKPQPPVTTTKNATPPPVQISGVKCQGCGKPKAIATHSNKLKQPLCSACNMRLIRSFGPDYGETLDNPAMSLRELSEAKEAKRDLKAVRKVKFDLVKMRYGLMNIIDDCELSDEHKARALGYFGKILEEFADVFNGGEA